jgi:hypothetical protein
LSDEFPVQRVISLTDERVSSENALVKLFWCSSISDYQEGNGNAELCYMAGSTHPWSDIVGSADARDFRDPLLQKTDLILRYPSAQGKASAKKTYLHRLLLSAILRTRRYLWIKAKMLFSVLLQRYFG